MSALRPYGGFSPDHLPLKVTALNGLDLLAQSRKHAKLCFEKHGDM